MEITTTISLTDKQSTAFLKRVTGSATNESLVETIVVDTAQSWADSDYSSTVSAIAEMLKSQPQAVLDSIAKNLSELK